MVFWVGRLEDDWRDGKHLELPGFEDGVNNWADFIKSGQAFFDANLGCPMFQLFDLMDELYRVAYANAPFRKIEDEDFFRRCFLVCHRALLSAATAISRGHAEDGAAPTPERLKRPRFALPLKLILEITQSGKALRFEAIAGKADSKVKSPRECSVRATRMFSSSHCMKLFKVRSVRYQISQCTSRLNILVNTSGSKSKIQTAPPTLFLVCTKTLS
jgi:hypothetical protein